MSDSLGLPIAIVLGIVLIGWYFVGNEVMRRRAHRLAVWANRVMGPFGGGQSIRWLGGQAFRLELDHPRAPFKSVALTGLVESWDVPMVWAWNRFHGRRDMIQLQASLRAQPMWGLELFRPGSMLAGDARGLARQEGWTESELDEFVVCAPSLAQVQLAAGLVQVVASERDRLVRLAVRRQNPHLTLALNVPDPTSFDAEDASRLISKIVDRLVALKD